MSDNISQMTYQQQLTSIMTRITSQGAQLDRLSFAFQRSLREKTLDTADLDRLEDVVHSLREAFAEHRALVTLNREIRHRQEQQVHGLDLESEQS